MFTDVIELTDADIEALMSSEKPCEFGQDIKKRHPEYHLCKDVAEGILIVRCPECGRRKAALMCTPCKNLAWKCIKVLKAFCYFAKNTKCHHKIRNFTVTWTTF